MCISEITRKSEVFVLWSVLMFTVSAFSPILWKGKESWGTQVLQWGEFAKKIYFCNPPPFQTSSFPVSKYLQDQVQYLIFQFVRYTAVCKNSVGCWGMCFWGKKCKNVIFFFSRRLRINAQWLEEGEILGWIWSWWEQSLKAEKGNFLFGFTVEKMKVLMEDVTISRLGCRCGIVQMSSKKGWGIPS